MKKKFFLPIFFTTLLLSESTLAEVVQAQQPQPIQIAQSVWKPFSSVPGKFTVLFPGTPAQTQETVDTPLGTINLFGFSAERPNEAGYLVAYSDFPVNLAQSSIPIEDLLAGIMSGFITSIGGNVLSQNSISLNGFPGQEARIQLKDNFITRYRVFIVNERLYQLAVFTDKEQDLPQSIEGFFNSFQLIE
ncbi:MAG: hypothetical protein WBG70_10625 [Spirulinaceae cyanobacterium]